ncbi:MAG: prepilin-type N-terminal cleavage/methylation domain-containing protein [Phycisphaerales bacterium]|nr:prepilin-type N-terminal cleavage/methylation domain-containing protein [Phycisphaerales bacterium]
MRSAFTLTEMMVAVAVLLVVIIATSKIFSTASQITGVGQATASMMTEAAAIEQRMRDDISKLTADGFFAIRCVAVRNDVKGAGQPLLDPNKPFNAFIRADQLVFFANGVESMQGFRQSEFGNHKTQGITSRIYYGHAFQIPNGEAVTPEGIGGDIARAHDPLVTMPGSGPAQILSPWYTGNIMMVRTMFCTIEGSPSGDGNGTEIHSATNASPLYVTQPDARQWLLARQAISLLDDDTADPDTNSKTVFLNEILTGRSIFLSGLGLLLSPDQDLIGHSKEVRNGRVNAAASQLDDIRDFITVRNPTNGAPRMWNSVPNPTQRAIIGAAVYYPRAERTAPGPHRVDQALTNPVISSACSSFMVDWTYVDGTGHVDGDHDGDLDFSTPGPDLPGIIFPPGMIEQPWFGMPSLEFAPADYSYADPVRGTRPLYYGTDPIMNWPVQQSPTSVYFHNIDGFPYQVGSLPVFAYEAFFGYNQTQPFWDETTAPPGGGPLGVPSSVPQPSSAFRERAGFTPWPSAIRVTMTLHDPDRKLEAGREFQFVIDLPKRTSFSR